MALISIPLLMLVVELLDNESLEKLSFVSNLVGVFSSITTLVIALFIFNRFQIDNFILEKQFNTINELLVEANQLYFSAEKENGHLLSIKFSQSDWHNDDYGDQVLIFGKSYREGMKKVFSLGNSVFMPKCVAKTIRNIDYDMYSSVDNKGDYNSFFRLSVCGCLVEDDKFMLANGEKNTIKDFSLNLEEIINKSKAWIKNNSDSSFDLNI